MFDVDILDDEAGRADVYVDDIYSIGELSDEKVEQKLHFTSLLALERVASPMAQMPSSVSKIHDNIVSLDKLRAEAGLMEIKTLLGWEIDTQ